MGLEFAAIAQPVHLRRSIFDTSRLSLPRLASSVVNNLHTHPPDVTQRRATILGACFHFTPSKIPFIDCDVCFPAAERAPLLHSATLHHTSTSSMEDFFCSRALGCNLYPDEEHCARRQQGSIVLSERGSLVYPRDIRVREARVWSAFGGTWKSFTTSQYFYEVEGCR